MDRIPSIGGTRGIFEIFIPGIFLLLNFTAAAFLTLPIVEFALKVKMDETFALFVSGLILISFGYLLGVMLRILRAERADLWSAGLLRILFRITSGFYKILRWFIRGTSFIDWIDQRIQERGLTLPLYLKERFPYTRWIGRKCHTSFPKEALRFYDAIWSATGKKGGKTFVNFCKVMLITEDETLTHEIYAPNH